MWITLWITRPVIHIVEARKEQAMNITNIPVHETWPVDVETKVEPLYELFRQLRNAGWTLEDICGLIAVVEKRDIFGIAIKMAKSKNQWIPNYLFDVFDLYIPAMCVPAEDGGYHCFAPYEWEVSETPAITITPEGTVMFGEQDLAVADPKARVYKLPSVDEEPEITPASLVVRR
jgi:hypothetical protein